MKHCGKSTHGRLLAERLGWLFFDTDLLIEKYYFNAYCSQLDCRAIYRKVGEKRFRQLECELIELLLTKSRNAKKSAIIALGGGLVANTAARPALRQLGKIVFLQVPYELLYQRVIRKGVPPFLDAEQPYESFMRICREREKYYLELADINVELGRATLKQANQSIFKAIKRYIDE